MRISYFLLLIFIYCLPSCDSDEPELIEDVPDVPILHPTADWMQKLIRDFADREVTLYDICIPRSHDAGMYILQNCTPGANACNVQTQEQDMRLQLMDGIRNFDIRPIKRNNFYFTRHAQSCEGLGCNGVRIDVMLAQVREFLDEHAELVILEFSSWCFMDGNDTDFRQMLRDELGDRRFTETGVNSIPFIKRPLADIIPPGQRTGKAIALVQGAADDASNRAEGIFAPSFISRTGSYANAQNFPDMKADQFEKYQNYNNDGTELFEFSWTLTQDVEMAIGCALPSPQQSIKSLAEAANPHLRASMDELIGSGEIQKGRIPNVISVDFCESFVTEECLRISMLNLE